MNWWKVATAILAILDAIIMIAWTVATKQRDREEQELIDYLKYHPGTNIEKALNRLNRRKTK